MSRHVMPVRTNVLVFIVLLVLLAMAIGLAFVNLGWFNFPLMMAISTCKALLILLFFMHVRHANRIVWVFSGAAFFWLAILLTLTLSDYFARGWLNIPGK